MDVLTVVIGTLVLAYGLFSGVMRFMKPGMFKKLQPMKERFGAAAGSAIHFLSYVLIPLGIGIALIVAGLNGISVLEVLS